MKKNILLFCLSFIFVLFSGCVQKENVETNDIKIRDNVFVNGNDGIIIDVEKNIAYYVFKENKLYFDAFTICENLFIDGLNNWDLPTYEELGGLVNIANKDTKKYDIFEDINDKLYWTKKDSNLGNNFRIVIDFKDGTTKHDHIFNENGFVCKSKIKLK